MIYITRREVFSASHQLFNPKFSDEKNKQIFGKCSNLHGHNYVIEVVLKGEIDAETGYLFDLKELKKILIEGVISKVDHKNLNTDVDFMAGIIPTTENLTIALFDQIKKTELSEVLYSVKIYETENNYFEFKGE